VRSMEGTEWTDWAELPGAGQSDTTVAAAVAGGECYVFAKGVDNKQPYLNLASDTGTWSGWQSIPIPGTTDVGFGAAAIGARVYLFAKGIQGNKVYVRRSQ
jgi:hypothetical protein